MADPMSGLRPNLAFMIGSRGDLGDFGALVFEPRRCASMELIVSRSQRQEPQVLSARRNLSFDTITTTDHHKNRKQIGHVS